MDFQGHSLISLVGDAFGAIIIALFVTKAKNLFATDRQKNENPRLDFALGLRYDFAQRRVRFF